MKVILYSFCHDCWNNGRIAISSFLSVYHNATNNSNHKIYIETYSKVFLFIYLIFFFWEVIPKEEVN